MALGFLTIFFGCTKDSSSPSSENSVRNYRYSDKPIYDWSINSKDLADQEFTQRIYRLAESFKTIINDHSDIKNFICDQAQHSERKAISFNSILNRYPEFRILMNERLSPLRDGDPLQQISDSLIYNGISYYPEVYIPNADIANFSLTPAIAIGTTVENNEAPGWIYEDDNYTDVLFNESFLSSSTPLMVIDNNTDWHSTPDFCYGDSLTSNTNHKNEDTYSTQDYHWKEMKIKAGYAFENDNTSEIRVISTCFNLTGGTVNTPDQGVFDHTVDYRWNIINESSDDIANSILVPIDNSVTGQASSNFYSAYPYVFETWFEYDWINSQKEMWCYPPPSGSIINHFNAKYADEWYSGICTFNQVTLIPNVNNYYTWDNTKSYFKDVRTQ